jgi:hypothetical protein
VDAEEGRQKVTRLELLKKEREVVKNLRCLSFDVKDAADGHYQTEIDAIEIYGAPNREVEEGGKS